VKADMGDIKWAGVSGQILTSAKLNDINTFENPNKLKIAAFAGAKKDGGNVVVTLPAHSVVVLELK
jgi:alpha-N-arabinofuranosidase